MSFSVGFKRDRQTPIFFDIAHADLEILHKLASDNPSVAKNIEVLFGSGDMLDSNWRTQTVSELLRNIQELRVIVSNEASRLAHTYQTVVEIIKGHVVSGSGGIGGIRINGELYGLDAGLGRCDLQKVAPTGGILEVRDARDLKEIQTDNMGTIKIKRRKRKTSLIQVLSEMETFLSSLPADETIFLGAG